MQKKAVPASWKEQTDSTERLVVLLLNEGRICLFYRNVCSWCSFSSRHKYLFSPVWASGYWGGLDIRNVSEMVCKIFPFRDQEALAVLHWFYFQFEHKPNLRAHPALLRAVLGVGVLVGCGKECVCISMWLRAFSHQHFCPQAKHQAGPQDGFLCFGVCWTRNTPQLRGTGSGSSASSSSSSWPINLCSRQLGVQSQIKSSPAWCYSFCFERNKGLSHCSSEFFNYFRGNVNPAQRSPTMG